ncbi:hypothetical protein [Teichococcus oryzae]|uniref:Uncharacterized protein n=1 Tax=Teichococcus oryzae TaxID=1608942 RepID=A0A5B2TBJ1_9PROT|nr:hypothetical protein [Pseudoroseomonas oryzae]KAA2211424.1 hypothetical protein F0Q34_20200 [Pseudoroseomonas oryzae]
MMNTVTILRPLGRQLMAKRYGIAPNGLVVKRDYSNAKRFRVEQAPVRHIHDLHHRLQRIERDPRACIIRGQPGAAANLADTDRRGSKNGGHFDDVPRPWVMLDLDKVKLPAGMSVIAAPQEVAQHLMDLVAMHVPELDGVTAIVQFSSSAGLEEQAEAEEAAGLAPRWRGVVKPGAGVGAHLWFWLEQAVDGPALDRWAKAINARVGHKLIDPATLRTVQPHYTAGPVFDTDLRDPLSGRRTLLVKGHSDAARLSIPAVAPRQPDKSGDAREAGRGFLGWMEAIGGPEGFHEPINRAIAAFVATNWPHPDTEWLKAALTERILAADPGGRSPSEIDRYASDANLDARIAWTTGREQEKRDAKAKAAASAAAQPIPPTYPDRGVSLATARQQAAEALRDFSAWIRAGEMPELLLRVTVGGGKTFEAIGALPELRAAGRAAGLGPVLFLHPRHALGDQIAADIRRRHPGLNVAIQRGMEAADPARPGQTMCQDPELPRAARAAGQSATAGCAACPLGPGCAYQLQGRAGRDADVWVAPHQAGFAAPFAGWPRVAVDDGRTIPVPPSAIIIDEDVTSAGVVGLNPLAPVQLALSALHSDDTPNLAGGDRELLLHLRRKAADALSGQPAGGLFRKPLEAIAATAGAGWAREWAALEWATKPRVRIARETGRAAALAAFAAAAGQRFTKLRPMLAERIGDFLDGSDARSVNLTLDPEADLGRGQGTGPAIRFAWREDFHPAWTAPLLFLDATGRPEVLRHWAPDLKVVDIEVAAPHQHVVQVWDQEFGRRWLQQPARVRSLCDAVMVELARADGAVLAILQKGVEALLRPELARRGAVQDPRPEGAREDDPSTWRFPSGAVLHLAHHGAVTGSNQWQEVATVMVIGRPATDRLDGERRAEVSAGHAVGVVPDAPDSWWPTSPGALRLADGSGRAIPRQPSHPDPLVEALRWSVSEAAVLQAIGRARGVRRTAENPVRVVVLAALALPVTVAEALTWADYLPDRVTTAAAEAAVFGQALPLAPVDMVTARRDLWTAESTAKRDLADFERLISLRRNFYKGNDPFKTLAPARYRKGVRGRWSRALVPLEQGQAVLEALIGPLAAFALDAPPPPSDPPDLAPALCPEPAERGPSGAWANPDAAPATLPDDPGGCRHHLVMALRPPGGPWPAIGPPQRPQPPAQPRSSLQEGIPSHVV